MNSTLNPCLCEVRYRQGAPRWEVLYRHPRKGWTCSDGLNLTPSATVLRWCAVEQLVTSAHSKQQGAAVRPLTDQLTNATQA